MTSPSPDGPAAEIPVDPRYPLLSVDEFTALFRRHPGGVTVITAQGPDGPVALTATSLASVSADPPLVMFSVSARSSSAPALTTASTLVIHFIDADSLDIAILGATSGIDRFADTAAWTRLATGEPVFHTVPAWTRAKVVERLETGNGAATVIIAQAIQSSLPAAGLHQLAERDTLAYVNRTWHRLDQASRITQ